MNSNPYHPMAFRILLRLRLSIAALAKPDWLSVRHLIELAVFLLVTLLLVVVRAWYVESRNYRRIRSLAYVEQRRGRILEDINHSEPLATILERVTELASMRLEGAPSWCEVAGGATLGHRPEQLPSPSLRVVEHPVASRSGPPLGAICTAFPVNSKPRAVELEALAMASELATLAIETSRLYSDLVRRSEFDLLTDIRNRFSLEMRLEALIDAARRSASIFGLIYIDLDNFKDVNDNFGHQAGDLYLREATQRMKRQVRPGDTLARLGGDEFAVLVPHVHSRAEVEEIAHRLEHCFSEVFVLNEHIVHGTASVGFALYPENAATVDSMLKAADDAMYTVKRKKQDERQQQPAPEIE